MKRQIGRLCGVMVAAAAALWGTSADGQTLSGLWNFDSGLNAAFGTDLSYSDTGTQNATKFGLTTTFGVSDINGTSAKVMYFPANVSGAGYYMAVPSVANGGNGAGTLLNSYTVMFDVYYPAGSNGKVRPLIQTDDGSLTGTPKAIAIFSNNGIGSSSGSTVGTVTAGKWSRIGLVFDSDAGFLKVYIDGENVGNQSLGSVDGSFALTPGGQTLILGTMGTDASEGYVNSVGFWTGPLNLGQMKALGTAVASGIPQTMPPVPSFIETRSPGIGETGVTPSPAIAITLMTGDTTISSSSISLWLDGVALNTAIGSVTGGYNITATPSTFLQPGMSHGLSLIYTDSSAGKQTNTWSFSVMSYQNITLPTPIYLETFDQVNEGELPTGWTVTNNTTAGDSGLDLDNPLSDSYLDFVVVSVDRLNSVFTSGNGARAKLPTIVLNGAILDTLMSGNLFYAESDYRDGNQVQVAFTSDYNLTGKSNIFVSWNSIYEQNQDSIESVEYSIDKGATWLPVIYYLDDKNGGGDIIKTNGVIDVTATFGTPRGDQAYGLAYSNFIGAVVGPSLIPYITPISDDNVLAGKRVEFVRIPKADNQPSVRFRLGQAGTGSWYFGVDNFGIYSVNKPVISTQPQSQNIDAGEPATFSIVAVSSSALKYQWQFNGANIPNATNDTYTIAGTTPSNVGNYTVVVSNSDGATTSTTAALTLVSNPVILSAPQGQLLSPGATISLTGQARGGRPLSYYWYKGSTLVSQGTNSSLVISNAQSSDAGYYAMVVSNSYGMATSSLAKVTIFAGGISDNLAAHLKFDGNYLDSTANGVNGEPVNQPTFETGFIGNAVHIISTGDNSVNNYVTLGYPESLKFGTNDFSVSFWTKINSQADDEPFVCNKNWDAGGNSGWAIASDSTGMKWNLNDIDKSGRHDSVKVAPQLEDKAWHLVTVTFERAGYGKIYVDGQLTDSTSIAPNSGVPIGSLDTDTLGLSINVGQDGSGAYTDNGANTPAIDMLMDDLGFWSRTLTPQEVASIYVQGLSGKDLTTASGKPVVFPPSITTSPISQAVSAGSTASFTFSPSGAGSLTYAWYKDGKQLSGANNTNLTFTASVADAGAYYAIVSNVGGTATSAVARLLVFSGSITNDLVVHLKLDGDYTDSSGRGNNATAVGSPTFVAGKLGQAMKFTTLKDGSTFNYATLGRPTDLQFATNDFSVSFWVNYTSSTDDPAFIGNKDWNGSDNQGWGVFTQNGGNFKVNAAGPNGLSDKYNTAYNVLVRDGTWHLITVSFWRGEVLCTYVDGALVSVKAFPTVGSIDSGLNLNVGQDGTGTYTDNGVAQIADALIDDVGIWRRVITQDEAKGIYTAGLAGKDLTQQGGVVTLELNYTVENATTVKFTWTANASVRLQKASQLGPNADWSDVTGTAGAGSYQVNATNTAAYYRLVK